MPVENPLHRDINVNIYEPTHKEFTTIALTDHNPQVIKKIHTQNTI